jgi:hypothetical protein
VSEFVDECRREWKRLGVADHLADEMAAELSADLDEAEAEGASSSEVLGSSALDPRSLAASWALERGLIHPRATEGVSRRHRRALALLVTFGFLVVIGGAAAILASETGQRDAHRVFALPDASQELVKVFDADSGEPITNTVWVAGAQALLRRPARDDEPGDNIDPIAWILLAVGVVGIISASLLWTASRRSRPPAPA